MFDSRDIANAFAHIEQTWSELTINQKNDNGTLVGLPFPYIIPSVGAENGFSFREMYYWDSYFIMRGLIQTGKTELAEGILENIINLFRRFHIVPNASRFYFTSRSQAPVMTMMIFDIYNAGDKNESWLIERLRIAEREYHTVWTNADQPNIRLTSTGLSRYYDINCLDDLAEAESGWDMTTRFGGKCLSFNPIDLNSLLYIYERDFARGYKIIGDEDTSDVWRQKAEHRAEIINELLWDKSLNFYFDYNYIDQVKSPVWSLAGYYPMLAGLTTDEHNKHLLDNLPNFTNKGGLVTTRYDQEPDPRPINKQWAYPNGWAPLNWIVCEGLSNQGYNEKAEEVARLWIGNNLNWFREYGYFRESYNVINPQLPSNEGLYPSQHGFGWTNGVFIDLVHKYLTEEEKSLI